MVYQEYSFSDDPYTKGGYAGVFTPITFAELEEEMRKPSGHIHWAGAETAEEYMGYMEGAVRSGERGIKQVKLKCPSERILFALIPIFRRREANVARILSEGQKELIE